MHYIYVRWLTWVTSDEVTGKKWEGEKKKKKKNRKTNLERRNNYVVHVTMTGIILTIPPYEKLFYNYFLLTALVLAYFQKLLERYCDRPTWGNAKTVKGLKIRLYNYNLKTHKVLSSKIRIRYFPIFYYTINYISLQTRIHHKPNSNHMQQYLF